MPKEEIALELTKLVYKDAIAMEGSKGNYDFGKIIADLYNYIFDNISNAEPNK